MNCENLNNGIICNLEMRYFSNCPRLNMGWFLCQNCNKDEYQRRFPSKEQIQERDSQRIFDKVVKELKNSTKNSKEQELIKDKLIEKLQSISLICG